MVYELLCTSERVMLTRRAGEQIAVPGEACRQRKSKVSIHLGSILRFRLLNFHMLIGGKCNGDRPSCKLCRERKQPCVYTSEPGISPIASLKRKYEALQAESADEHDLLGFLRTASEGDAIKVLAYPRSSDDVQGTLEQAQNAQEAPEASLGQETLNMPQLNQTMTQYDPQTDPVLTDAPSMDAPSIYPELSETDGRIPWALPIEPYVRRCTPLVASS